MHTPVTMVLTVLALTTAVALAPAQAREDHEAALKRQLDEVRQQLHELQLKLEHLETEFGAAQAPSSAAVGVPGPSSTPVPATTAAPLTDAPPSPAPAPVEAGTSPAPAAAPAAFQWREMLKDQWRRVEHGMSGEEIRKLLGPPSREFSVDGKPVWYYAYPGIGNGSVMFSRDGRIVADWQHPPFGFW